MEKTQLENRLEEQGLLHWWNNAHPVLKASLLVAIQNIANDGIKSSKNGDTIEHLFQKNQPNK
jgi:hypothetical protein